MKTINRYAYNSKLKDITPNAKIAFGVVPLLLCIGLNSISVSIFTLILMLLLSLKYSSVSLTAYLKLLLIPVSFLILGILPIIFIAAKTETALFSFSLFGLEISITKASLQTGVLLFIKALGAVSCMYFISLTTTMSDILTGLVHLKLPKILVSLTELIYRYIFVMFEEARKIRIAQRSRMGYKDFKTSVTSTGGLIASLFIKTYSKCDRVYNALTSRGYDGEISVLDKEYKSSPLLVLGLAATVIIMLLVGMFEKEVFQWIL